MRHSLQYELTKTILVWSGVFFTLLAITFLVTFDDLKRFALDRTAEKRLQYQTYEFSRHFKQNDRKSVREESDALVQDPRIAGIILVDSSGELIHASVRDTSMNLQSFHPITLQNILETVGRKGHLHLYKSRVPETNSILYLVLDDRQIAQAIEDSTIVSATLLLVLLGLSILCLHRTLHRQLVVPIERTKNMIGKKITLPEEFTDELEANLPAEACEILETYDELATREQSMEHDLLQIINHFPGCIWSAKDDLRYHNISTNALNIFGYSESEIKGKELWSWISDGKVRRKNIKRLRHAIAKKAPNLELVYHICINDEEKWYGENIYLHYNDMENGHNRVLGIFGISNDITKRKIDETRMAQMQEQARKMEAVGTLVGGIAHEFNNMLAGIVGNLFLLKMEAGENEKITERLKRIEKLSNRAAGLVDQLLAFGRKQHTTVRDVELGPLLEQIYAIESAALPEHIKLHLHTDNKDGYVRMDPVQFRQIIGSLVSNAADACNNSEKGEIYIETTDDVGNDELFLRHPHLKDVELACVRVRDNGEGIPKQYLDRVFDPFFTTKEVGQGTGMGLAMVYGLIESFGGAVDLQSETGVGTVVSLYLQRASERTAELQADEPGSLNYGQAETILVVDDEDMLRDAAAESLEKINYVPVRAASGQQALDYLAAHPDEVSLVLLDVVMPGLNGRETAARIRETHPQLPIIFVTGFNLGEDQNQGLNIAHSALVYKPYDSHELSRVISRMLRRE